MEYFEIYVGKLMIEDGMLWDSYRQMNIEDRLLWDTCKWMDDEGCSILRYV